MTHHPPKNIAASIHQRLLNASRDTGRLFNDLVLYYGIERFLYRLSQSPYADRVMLKGGLMLKVWNVPTSRITRDIDLLGKVKNDPEQIKQMVQSICSISFEDDGLTFDPQSVSTSRIAEDADYEGVRVTFKGHLGKVLLSMQIDFGFSDVVTPAPVKITYPSVLGHASPQLLAYNRETAVAEKFEAMVKLGELNSRMKDFFDIWALANNFTFDGQLLTDAIRSTFERRQTAIEDQPDCFTQRFITTPAKAAQWKGFIKHNRIDQAPTEFSETIAGVKRFLQPVAHAIAQGQVFQQYWPAGGDWQ